ncbi:redox-regulated ATPase YchF [Candidatus Blochmannia ocreatus (nom. nud.)]|uniref:Redox-regulated ATPase YchF n=1 Tax=Candidatus Blochmannia ocreatus (nom. nud.) TaxID=251538 RepID=A0ABY4SVF3_9ENTR|nr:redox-regulated ATPase YchF [Candidatus Blochmannia ocreatus]URJ25404.1 redox-regulated ATPase YchF [Candidatus Blochmannia ocreatus]
MQIDCSIIGLPNTGKSALFNILTDASVRVANFPFCTIQPNVAVMYIPDNRIYMLADIAQSHEVVQGTVRFVDVAGLIKGAAQGIGMGNKIFSCINTTKILFHMIRCFIDNKITHIFNNIDPCRDINIVNDELILFDILQCEKIISTLEKQSKSFIKNNDIKLQLSVLRKCLHYLYDGIFLSNVQFAVSEKMYFRKINLLTAKPTIYIINTPHDITTGLNNIYLDKLYRFLSAKNSSFILCNFLSLFLDSKNNILFNKNKLILYKNNFLHEITSKIFSVLDLCVFFTVNANMARAWVCKSGITALEASQKVHSDFSDGFIKVQVIKYNDFIKYKGESGSKKFGKIFYEGKNYCIRDGDVLKFLFNRRSRKK